MTCIVSLVEDNVIHMAGDSAGVDTNRLLSFRRDDPKVFLNGNFIFGFTSSFRMGNLLQYKLECPKQPHGMDDMKFMVCLFVESVRKCFKENGFGSAENGGTFIVGYNGKLYTIYGDYQVACHNENYCSVGCGSEFALGSMYTTDKLDLDPKERLTISLNAASHFSAGVAAPYTFLSLENLGSSSNQMTKYQTEDSKFDAAVKVVKGKWTWQNLKKLL